MWSEISISNNGLTTIKNYKNSGREEVFKNKLIIDKIINHSDNLGKDITVSFNLDDNLTSSITLSATD